MANPAQKVLSRINLNLLYPQGLRPKLLVRFLKWLISYGRFIVVAVEIVVLVTFAMRFKLDNDLAELNDQIKQQVPYLESLSVDEALIKQTHLRLSTIKTVYATASSWKNILTKISSLTPVNVRVTSLNLENVSAGSFQFKITARANSNTLLSAFINSLKSDASFKDVTLAGISFEEGQIVFTITGATK